jgi:uncharacterized membrane protein YphA (DoxX/SURF4 family)
LSSDVASETTPPPRRVTARGAIALASRLVLAAVLGVAGALKLRDPAGFAQEIANYQLAPELAPYVAAALPVTELLIALGLLLPLPRQLVAWRRAAGLAAGVVLAAFTVAVVSVVGRGINIDCGCFGAGSGPVSGLTVLRNLSLLALAGAVTWIPSARAITPG